MILNIEEMSLLQIFDTTDRKSAINSIIKDLPIIYDEGLKNDCQQLATKINTMTEMEFKKVVDNIKEELWE